MHRGEVRIFRGNVEAHLRRLHRVGAGAPLVEADPVPMKVCPMLDYGRLRPYRRIEAVGAVVADMLAMSLALGVIVALVWICSAT